MVRLDLNQIVHSELKEGNKGPCIDSIIDELCLSKPKVRMGVRTKQVKRIDDGGLKMQTSFSNFTEPMVNSDSRDNAADQHADILALRT